ncbi:hypothetical protein K402DRAFT_395194 [Aulographum hederae CBS 113979]|uniref:DUF7907 domain-containing protein n=1 Tax=Aulographum hederae CBS 113979 TaxID=1176131 RepID=A0A6G1GWF7_9PEZI|nr:hypothetical protein K402DRAFT_395194 [Aulographum hederae CBS 113979]
MGPRHQNKVSSTPSPNAINTTTNNLQTSKVHNYNLVSPSLLLNPQIHSCNCSNSAKMRSVNFTLLCASILTWGITTVQAVQSAPFNLKICAPYNETLDNAYLFACHEGAAIEGLCIGDKAIASKFYLNTSTDQPDSVNRGIIVWNLPVGNDSYSQGMQFSFNPASNVVMPLFMPDYPGAGQEVGFPDDGKMAIVSYRDDSMFPPSFPDEPLRRWYVCITYWGYTYTTLVWVAGKGEPQNPTCEPVNVVREFL